MENANFTNPYRFVLFNDTWSQEGHSVACMTILFRDVQISRSDIRPHIKWAVSLVILHMVFYSSSGVCVGMYGLTYSFYHPEGSPYRTLRLHGSAT